MDETHFTYGSADPWTMFADQLDAMIRAAQPWFFSIAYVSMGVLALAAIGALCRSYVGRRKTDADD